MADRPKKSEEKCNGIKFSDLCVLFEKIEKTAGSANKLRLLFNKDMKKFLGGQSIFPLLRLVLPLNDTDRGSYGLKQASVAKTYVSALHLDAKTSEDARRLLNWKDPSKAHGIEMSKIVVGDFGLILEDILKSRVRAEFSDKTIGDVNALLDALANSTSTEEKTNIIRTKILNEFSANEQKWLARIIFRDMKIGLKHEQVLSSFYPNALKRYNECTNLKLVCEEEGITSELAGLQVGTKFSPMLAKGFSTSGGGQVAAVEVAMKNDPFVMDIKLDGERMQCHIDSSDNSGGGAQSVTLFTRRGNDYTENYLPVAQIVRDNILAGSPTRNQNKLIIDGEICAWDIVLQEHMPFGNNLTVAKVERELRETFPLDRDPPPGWDRNLPSCMFFIAFDIVYFDGPDASGIIDAAMEECGIQNRFVDTGEITNLPLAVRRKILSKIINPVVNRFDTVKHRTVLSQDVVERRHAIEAFFNEVTVDGEEGLVIKNLTSTYELGERSRGTGSWVKMKPEYGDQTEDLDLLILGAYYGEGTGMRGEGLSTFLCGIRNDKPGAEEGSYLTLAKVGTGYSFDELRDLRERLKDIVVPWKERQPPAHLAHWAIAKRDDRPNVWIPPEQSIVVQLKCAELVDSYAFSAGITCRFPRLQRIRYDKAPAEIMRWSEVVAIKDQVRDTTHQMQDKTNGVAKKQKKKTVTAAGGAGGAETGAKKRTHAVDDQFRISNKKVRREGRIFEGLVFCVLESEFVYNKPVDFSSSSASGAASAASTQLTQPPVSYTASQSYGGTGSYGSYGSGASSSSSRGRGTQNYSLGSYDTQGTASSSSSSSSAGHGQFGPFGFTQTQFTQPQGSFSSSSNSGGGGYTQATQDPDQSQTQFQSTVGAEDGGSSIRKYTREELINEIKAQGGEVVASPTLPECRIVAGNKRTFQLNNYIEQGNRDVIDFSYIVDCITAGELLPLKCVHYLGYSAATRKAMRTTCNPFGDSYTEDTAVEDLKKILLSAEGVVSKIQKDPALTGGPKKALTAAQRKKAVAMGVDVDEEVGEEEAAENRAILQDWNDMESMGWRELCVKYLREEEREPVYFSDLNCMWSDRTVLYLDMFVDLGSCYEQTPAAVTTTTTTATSNKRTTASRSKSSASSTASKSNITTSGNPPLNAALVDASNSPHHATAMKVLYHRLVAYGATVSENLNGAVTHIVMLPDNLGRAQEIKDRIRLLRTLDQRSFEKRIVTPAWVEHCVERGRMDEPRAVDGEVVVL